MPHAIFLNGLLTCLYPFGEQAKANQEPHVVELSGNEAVCVRFSGGFQARARRASIP